MLVPLTNSLYVPGVITNKDHFVVDIGTGYYVEKSADKTQDFLTRKIELVKAKLADLEGQIMGKKQGAEQVNMVIREKVQLEARKGTVAGAGGPQQDPLPSVKEE